MSDKKHKVGIIGYGWAATAHIDAINKTTNGIVTSVCSARPLDATALSSAHGSPMAVYNDLDKMLADPEIDVVSITGYPDQHRDQTIAAAAAGKHVIIEKPLALTLEDTRAMRAAVAKAGVRSCVCFELRFISQFQTIRALLDEGLVGDLHYGEIDYYHGIGPWYGQYRWNTTKANGGSSLLSAGCHALDALLLCMGDDVVEVTSYATQSSHAIFEKYEYPTTTATLLKFASGKVGKCASVIDCFQPYYFHTHLVGSEGSILDDKLYSNKLHLRDKKWTQLPIALADSGDVADHPYQAQFQAFFDALDREEEMPLTSLEQAGKTFEVLFAADRSVATGKPVRVGEM
jgi:predicted dehydrogenase